MQSRRSESSEEMKSHHKNLGRNFPKNNRYTARVVSSRPR
jgi:hypothetical protein